MSDSVNRDRMLAGLGFSHPDAARAALAALVEAKLTLEHKENIAAAKRADCEALLAGRFLRRCHVCEAAGEGDDGRRAVPASRPDCEVCGGSANRHAVERAVGAFRRRGLKRLVVVGGSEATHKDFVARWRAAGLEVRVVDGTSHHTAKDARANAAWADVIAVWGSTVLPHKVSKLYTDPEGPDAAKVAANNSRGVASLADRLCDHLS